MKYRLSEFLGQAGAEHCWFQGVVSLYRPTPVFSMLGGTVCCTNITTDDTRLHLVESEQHNLLFVSFPVPLCCSYEPSMNQMTSQLTFSRCSRAGYEDP